MDNMKPLDKELWEELEGFVESWRDDAAQMRSEGDQLDELQALAYDECADELEAFLKRGRHTIPNVE